MSNAKVVEVELRGPLDEATYGFLEEYCKAHSASCVRQVRILIDYSTFLEGIGTRRLDVRLRVTNGAVEVVVKEGVFGGTHRKEASIFVKDNDLEGALRLLALLGYKRGVACDRGITRYQLGGIEVALQDVRMWGRPERVHSRFYEAEILTSEVNQEVAETRLKEFLDRLRLKVFAEDEWNQYVEQMNREANGVFEFDESELETVVARYGSVSSELLHGR